MNFDFIVIVVVVGGMDKPLMEFLYYHHFINLDNFHLKVNSINLEILIEESTMHENIVI